MTSTKTPLPYGTWPGNITADMIVKSALRFSGLKTEDDNLYWCEQRSEEAGRGVIMQWSATSGTTERLPAPFSARSKVHEYGGGEFCVHQSVIYFVNAHDQQIYRCQPEASPEQITDAPGFRFADPVVDHANHRLVAVAERHHDETTADAVAHHGDHPLPENMLVYIGFEGRERGGVSVLEDSCDFYASPRLSPDGKTLAWLHWNLPHMPWEDAALMVRRLDETGTPPIHIAGGNGSACFGPRWDESGALYFITDKGEENDSGYGQLYRWADDTLTLIPGQDSSADNLLPQWVFGLEAFCLTSDGQIYLSGHKDGALLLQHLADGKSRTIPTPAKALDSLQYCSGHLAALTTTDDTPQAVALLNTADGLITTIRPSADLPAETRADISIGNLITFEGPLGPTFGLYYPPTNANHCGTEGAAPPTILTVHGGPTGMANRGLKMKTQYWTNRGFAVFDVDYAGSSGYGKAYRERLSGGWGIHDVKDIIAAANHLVKEGLANPDQLVISGGSAGGYTCLMALIESDLFKCASCSYPVTDLSQLLEITHKFELGYTYGLTGTTKETASQRLGARSVLHHIAAIKAPVIFFQGKEDKVVPPSQPIAVHEALKTKGIDTQLHLFEGEGHGFRAAQTIRKVLDEEEKFFKKSLGINP